jgi:hypothetical protein
MHIFLRAPQESSARFSANKWLAIWQIKRKLSFGRAAEVFAKLGSEVTLRKLIGLES